jgi:hypothetical protein
MPTSQETRSNAFSLTRRRPQRYAAGMRNLLLPLAVVAFLALVGPSCADFDSGGTGPAKPKATQAAGTTFDSSVAASKRVRAADDIELLLTGVRPLVFAVPLRIVVVRGAPAVPRSIIKNPSNIPRPRRPADLPLSIDW